MIEENLSTSMSKVCRKYDEVLFTNIFLAYEKLDKIDTLFDKLSQNFMLTINTVCLQTLIKLIVSRRFSLNDNHVDDEVLASKIDSYVDELKQKNYSNDLFTVNYFF